MTHEDAIPRHEQGLLNFLDRQWRPRARSELERDGEFPISELEDNADPRWAEPAPADLGAALRARGARAKCVLFKEEYAGLRKEIVPLDDAVALVDGDDWPFLISCLTGTLAYYHGEHRNSRIILDRTSVR